jgi:lipid A 3-O-deacylase
MMRRIHLALLGCALISGISGPSLAAEPVSVFRKLGPVDLHGDGPNFFNIGTGIFDYLRKGKDASLVGRVEIRIGKKLFFVGPALGLLANTDGGLMGYAGIYVDLSYRRFVFTTAVSLGGYHKGDSVDLGGISEFREEFTLSYRFDDQSRLGVVWAHISNARTHDKNPGENEVLVTYAIPF